MASSSWGNDNNQRSKAQVLHAGKTNGTCMFSLVLAILQYFVFEEKDDTRRFSRYDEQNEGISFIIYQYTSGWVDIPDILVVLLGWMWIGATGFRHA
jgi:hypothetical protein